MAGIALALLSSLAWGVADFLGGIASRRINVLAVLSVSQPVGLALAAVGVLLSGAEPPAAGTLALAAGAGAVTLAALAAYYAALAIGPIGVVAPLGALGVVIPVAAGVVSGDRPAAIQAAGIAIAIVGVLLAARETGQGAAVSGRAISLGLAAAVGFGAFLLIVDHTASQDPWWTLLAVRVGGCVAIGGAVLRAGGAGPVQPVGLPTLAAVGTFEAAAIATYAVATTKGDLALVSVAGSLYPAVAAVLAWLVLREKLAPPQRAGVVLAAAGIAMIAGGA